VLKLKLWDFTFEFLFKNLGKQNKDVAVKQPLHLFILSLTTTPRPHIWFEMKQPLAIKKFKLFTGSKTK
jgi:hypothetical protein